MKTLILCAFLLTTSLFLQFTLLSCNRGDTVFPDAGEQLQENIWKSKSQYLSAMNARTHSKGVKFSIEDVERKDNFSISKFLVGARKIPLKLFGMEPLWNLTLDHQPGAYS